uniref:Secreted protein n=1 Tax=Anser cygnoides TaxID=8845 RepID=A0A8B9E5Z0_ANSCY
MLPQVLPIFSNGLCCMLLCKISSVATTSCKQSVCVCVPVCLRTVRMRLCRKFWEKPCCWEL